MNANQLAQCIELECHDFILSERRLKEAIFYTKEFDFNKLVVSFAQVDFLSTLNKSKKALKIAYPYGQSSLDLKLKEIKEAYQLGFSEVEYVANHYLIKNKDYEAFKEEVDQMVLYARKYHLKLKVLIETAVLSKDELAKIARILKKSKIDFIKISIFEKSSFEDTLLLKTILNKDVKIVVNNVDDFKEALAHFKAGANRVSSHHARRIIEEFKELYE